VPSIMNERLAQSGVEKLAEVLATGRRNEIVRTPNVRAGESNRAGLRPHTQIADLSRAHGTRQEHATFERHRAAPLLLLGQIQGGENGTGGEAHDGIKGALGSDIVIQEIEGPTKR